MKNHKIQPSVRQRDKITAQRGDVLGYRVTRLGGNGQGGIQLKPPDGNSYTSDMVWYTQPSPNGIQEYRILRTGCSYCIGEGRSLPTQSVAAPVLIASLGKLKFSQRGVSIPMLICLLEDQTKKMSAVNTLNFYGNFLMGGYLQTFGSLVS